MPIILIRADASPAKGTGHVMRCLALADALRERGADVAFATAEITPALVDRLASDGFAHHALTADDDAAATLDIARRIGATALVVDSYWLDADWRRAVRGGFGTVLALDDLADRALHADLVWNPSPVAADLPYDRIAPGTVRLFGSEFLLLRREIRDAITAPRPDLADRTSILLTFGGSDPAGLTVPLVKRLAPSLPAGIRLDVVAGGSNPSLACVRAVCARFPDQVRLHVDTNAMGALMATCGLAVTAGGGTVAELAALAIPCLLAIVADNQEPSATDATTRGWASVIDARGDRATAADALADRTLSLWADPVARAELSRRIGADGIDALGAPRVATALLAHIDAARTR